nr:hypothetical protein [Shuttleworthia satelles]
MNKKTLFVLTAIGFLAIVSIIFIHLESPKTSAPQYHRNSGNDDFLCNRTAAVLSVDLKQRQLHVCLDESEADDILSPDQHNCTLSCTQPGSVLEKLQPGDSIRFSFFYNARGESPIPLHSVQKLLHDSGRVIHISNNKTLIKILTSEKTITLLSSKDNQALATIEAGDDVSFEYWYSFHGDAVESLLSVKKTS